MFFLSQFIAMFLQLKFSIGKGKTQNKTHYNSIFFVTKICQAKYNPVWIST